MVLIIPQNQETPKTAPETQQQTPPAQERDMQAFIENMTKERDEKVEQIKSTFEARMGTYSGKISLNAIGVWETMKNRQINEIYNLYNLKIEEVKKPAQNREALANQLMEEAGRKADTRNLLLTMLIDGKKKGEKVTTEEVGQVDKAVKGLMEFEKSHAHLQPLLEKIAKKQQPLEKADYEAVVAILSPLDITKEGAVSASAFEATAAGILVGAMTAQQRVELIKVFMEGNRRSETPALMDAFLGMGIITDAQARELLKGTPFEEEIIGKMDSGKYYGERAALANQRDAEAEKYRGIYNENVVGRFVGMPLLGVLAMAWGVTTFAINALMARQTGEKNPFKWLGRVAKNPRAWLGLGVAAGGLEASGTSMKMGDKAPLVGGGAISRAIGRLGESDEENDPKEKAKNIIREIKETAPKVFKTYLENGGYAALKNLRTEIIRERSEGKPRRNIELSELKNTENDPAQRSRLEAMLAMPQATQSAINLDLGKVAEAGYILKLKTNDEFLKQWSAKPETGAAQSPTDANNPPNPHAAI